MDYERLAECKIIDLLPFTHFQKDLIGRILSIEQEELVDGVEVKLTNVSGLRGEVLTLGRTPRVSVNVYLAKKYEGRSHQEILDLIKDSVSDRGIEEEIFSYCTKSYGIETREDIDVSFGFRP